MRSQEIFYMSIYKLKLLRLSQDTTNNGENIFNMLPGS